MSEKYKLMYENFIKEKRNRKVIKTDFFEVHHILPKSMGGSDSEENLVKLTPREHYFAHLLLARFTTGADQIKMAHALRMMSGLSKKQNIVNSKQYELAKSIVYTILQTAGKTYQEEKHLQDQLLTEYSDLEKVYDRGICKSCGIRPKGINYIKNNKIYYRSKCDVCARGKNKLKLPLWKKEGYVKRKNCEICNFIAKVSEQLTVITEYKKYKTICLNCQIELTVDNKKSVLKPISDF
jgi:hypothetical protein